MQLASSRTLVTRRALAARGSRFVAGCFACGWLLAIGSLLALAAPPPAAQFFPAGAMRGQTVTVQAIGEFPMWPVEAWVAGEGVTITAEKDAGKFQVRVAADAAPGARLVRLFNKEGAATPGAFVVGTLPEIGEEEPNDETTKPQAVALPAVTINGRLEKRGEVDVFSVALRAGQTLIARIEAERPLGSPMDSVLQLLTTAGFVITQNHDTNGLDPQLQYTAPRDETVLVRLFSFPSVPDTTIRLAGGEKYVYRLTLTTGPLVDYAFPLAIGRSTAAEVRLQGWNLAPAAAVLALTPPADRDTLLAFRPELAGTSSVAVFDMPTLVEVEPNDAEHPQAVTPPFVVSGRIDAPGDVDVYAVTGKKQDRFVARVVSQRLGFPLDAVVTVIDEAGKQLAKKDDTGDGRDVEVPFTLPADGVCRIEVSDLYRAGSPRHAYYLSVVRPELDYGLSLAADEFVVEAGKTLEIPVTIDRRDGFGQEIELSVTGSPAGTALPAGTVCNAMTSAVKGDTAKIVKLSLTAGTQPFSGPITIVGLSTGNSKGAAPLRRIALVNLKGLNTQTDQPWLTIRVP